MLKNCKPPDKAALASAFLNVMQNYLINNDLGVGAAT